MGTPASADLYYFRDTRMSRIESGLMSAIEEALSSSSQPMDCHQLFKLPSIRAHARTVNRVSDYLGNMWRKGLLTRLPAAKVERGENDEEGPARGGARWVYQLRPQPAGMVAESGVAPDVSRLLLKKPTIEITEHGGKITIDLPNLVLTIRTKQ